MYSVHKQFFLDLVEKEKNIQAWRIKKHKEAIL